MRMLRGSPGLRNLKAAWHLRECSRSADHLSQPHPPECAAHAGQSQPPNHLSMFLEVTDPRAPADWSCFVSHRLSVVNQRAEPERSVSKESQNRYSKQAKDWGWREFITMTHLFDQASGFLVGDAMLFSAEVMVLREATETRVLPALDSPEASAAEANDLALALRQPASAAANAVPAETYSTTGPQVGCPINVPPPPPPPPPRPPPRGSPFHWWVT